LVILTVAEEGGKFEYIYTQYKNLMYQKANAILQDSMLAEDAVSEAYMRIYKNMHKIDNPASGRCIAFIVTIVKNTALTLLSKQNRQVISIDELNKDDGFDLEQFVCSEISSEEIYRLINQLSEELRSVFLLRFAYDLSHRKIGEMLNITENNVTVRLHRAKKRIAALLIKEGYAVEQ
jgi:RNA polymerase sigma-70 factor (ECF subfamily)